MRNEDLREIIEANFQAMRARIQAQCDITDLLRQEMKKQNGRIDNVEKETSFFRLIHRNPGRSTVVVVAVVLGAIFAYKLGIWIF